MILVRPPNLFLHTLQQSHHLRHVVQVVFILIGVSYIIICPYNKVEESFNIQATHDLYYIGLQPAVQRLVQNNDNQHFGNLTKIPFVHWILTTMLDTTTLSATTTISPSNATLPYDHLQYPGVVPRTFIGPFILSWICYIIRTIILFVVYLFSFGNSNGDKLIDISHHPYIIQFLSRLVLLLFNVVQFFNMVTSIDHLVDTVGRLKSPFSSSSSVPSTVSQSSATTNDINHMHLQHPPHSMIGTYLIIITGCQFHLLYYYSRMLPNTFACIFTLRSYYHWIKAIAIRYQSSQNLDRSRTTSKSTTWYSQHHVMEMIGAMIDLTLATMIFRCDCVLLLGTVGLTWIITRQLTFLQGITIGIFTVSVNAFCSLITILPLDSILWQRFVWAEGEVFYYNTILNKSSNWGVSAWHWYFTSALPKALLLPIFFIPLSFVRIPELLVVWEQRLRQYLSNTKFKSSNSSKILFDATYLQFLLPAFGFVLLYSTLGHKEVRFLYPALPLFNICAAVGLYRLHEIRFPTKDKIPSLVAKILYVLAMLAILVSFLASVVFVATSRYNYPGGDALHLLRNRVYEAYSPRIVSNNDHTQYVKVHIDVASAMTGVNLFGQSAAKALNPNIVWSFDKDGYEEENENANLNWSSYTHLLTEAKDITGISDAFTVVGVAQGNPRLDFRRGVIATSDAIYVLERKNWITNP